MSALRYSKRLRRRSQEKKKRPRPTRGSTRRAHARKKAPGLTRRSTRPKGFLAKNTVFLCYRSIDAGWALAIAQNLRAYGY